MLRQALVLLALVCPASSAFAESASPVELRILAINDFHGYLQPPPAA
jgi:5'-nucleotidase